MRKTTISHRRQKVEGLAMVEGSEARRRKNCVNCVVRFVKPSEERGSKLQAEAYLGGLACAPTRGQEVENR